MSQDKQEIAKIPFAFHASHNSFAAGDYRVAQVNNYGLFQLTKEADSHSIFINTLPAVGAKSNSQGHLTFACYQGDCVLSQICCPAARLDMRARPDR